MIYNDIHDCPVKIFHRILETGNIQLLVYETLAESIAMAMKGEGKKPEDEKKLWEVFEKLKGQQIDKFGVCEESATLFYKQNTINKLEIKKLEGDLQADTQIKLIEAEIIRLKKNAEKEIKEEDLGKHHAKLYALVEDRFKRRIDDLSIMEFYTYLYEIIKQDKFDRLTKRKTA